MEQDELSRSRFSGRRSFFRVERVGKKTCFSYEHSKVCRANDKMTLHQFVSLGLYENDSKILMFKRGLKLTEKMRVLLFNQVVKFTSVL